MKKLLIILLLAGCRSEEEIERLIDLQKDVARLSADSDRHHLVINDQADQIRDLERRLDRLSPTPEPTPTPSPRMDYWDCKVKCGNYSENCFVSPSE